MDSPKVQPPPHTHGLCFFPLAPFVSSLFLCPLSSLTWCGCGLYELRIMSCARSLFLAHNTRVLGRCCSVALGDRSVSLPSSPPSRPFALPPSCSSCVSQGGLAALGCALWLGGGGGARCCTDLDSDTLANVHLFNCATIFWPGVTCLLFLCLQNIETDRG